MAVRLPDFRAEWILYRDEHLIVVHKEPGISCQAADPSRPHDLVARLKRYLGAERRCPAEQVYLGVHQRLDRDTSGCLLYTLDRAANPAIARQFEGRSVEQTYRAVVDGRPRGLGERPLVHGLVKGKDGRMHVARPGDRHARQARTRVKLLRSEGGQGGRSLIELGCDTGRTHQLRVQLAHVGHPVAGDLLYGEHPAPRLMLHAARLRLRHPIHDEPLEVNDPAPHELEAFLETGELSPAAAAEALAPRLWRRGVQLAAERRFDLFEAAVAQPATTAFRWVHGEADGLPGLHVDVYDRWLVANLYDEQVDRQQAYWLDALMEPGFEGVYLKRHPRQKNQLVDTRDVELAPSDPVRGQPAPERLVIQEHGMPFEVCLHDGLRTGLFLDQRANRLWVREHARGLRVLNLFAYTGGFSVAALLGGAQSVTSVDTSGTAIQWCARNVERVGGGSRHQAVTGDVFDALPAALQRGDRYDLIVLDPPSYAKTRRRRFQLKKDYAELAAAAIELLTPGGRLLACLNHQGVSQNRLRRFIHEAGRQAGRSPETIRELHTGGDFPAVMGREPDSKSALVTLPE